MGIRTLVLTAPQGAYYKRCLQTASPQIDSLSGQLSQCTPFHFSIILLAYAACFIPDTEAFQNSPVQLRCRQPVKIAHKTDGIKELKRARAKNACFRCTSRSGLEPGYLKRVVVLFGSHFIYLTAYPTFLFPNSILWHSQIPLVYLLLQIPVFLTFPITLVADSRRWIVGHFPSIFQAPRCGTCPPILHSL